MKRHAPKLELITTNCLDIKKSSYNIVIMKCTVTKAPEPIAYVSFFIERYDIGIGVIGKRRLKNKKYRRFLRARNEHGCVTYFVWNGEEKGKEVIKLIGFIPIKRISRDAAAKHFRKIS